MKKLSLLLFALVFMTPLLAAPVSAQEMPIDDEVQHGRVDPHHVDAEAGEKVGYGDDHGGDYAGEESPSPFAGTIAQSVAAIIVFLALLALLTKYAWAPILSGLQDREKKIADDLRQAEAARDDAKKTLAEYEQRLAEAQSEARKMLDKTRQDADALRARLTAETEAELAKVRDKAATDIDLAKQQALQEIYATSAELATAVAGKILQRQITEQDTQRLIDQSLQELNKPTNN